MGRLFFLLALVIAGVLLWRGLKHHIKRAQPVGRPKIRSMVRCDYCGTHVPQDELVQDNGRRYCSSEHRALDRDNA